MNDVQKNFRKQMDKGLKQLKKENKNTYYNYLRKNHLHNPELELKDKSVGKTILRVFRKFLNIIGILVIIIVSLALISTILNTKDKRNFAVSNSSINNTNVSSITASQQNIVNYINQLNPIENNIISDANLRTKDVNSYNNKTLTAREYLHISYSEEGYLGCNWEKEVRDDFFFCSAGVNVGSLLADGSYSACPSLSREWIQGHVDEIGFSEAWETRYKNMRDRKWMRTDGCKSCRQWNKCNGSSLHLWDFKEGKTKVCHYNMLNESI